METKTIAITMPTKPKCDSKKLKPTSTNNNETASEKKRVASEKWTFSLEDYSYENQLNNIKQIYENEFKSNNQTTKIALQEIHRKIYSYKQQDLHKNHLDNNKFIHLESIIERMIECQLKCYYCQCEMLVLYDISRENRQWSVDRINNDLGHNIDNYYLACLECNLRRRRRSDDKFLFTKQMKLVKIIGENK
jgi:hypothetical protein